MLLATVYGERLWHQAMALATELCHTERTSPEALGGQREIDQ
jgi:hypothetical protein